MMVLMLASLRVKMIWTVHVRSKVELKVLTK